MSICHSTDHVWNLVRDDSNTKTVKCSKCDLSVEVIPKDCVVCDICNKQLSDENFVATCDSYWFEGSLNCKDCNEKYPRESKDLKMKIIKDDDLSNTELAMPIMMTSGADFLG